jgi:hypothetical protein
VLQSKDGLAIALGTIGLIALLTSSTTLGQVRIPNTFRADQPARAAEVNANFSALASELDAEREQIMALESAVAALESELATLRARLAGLSDDWENTTAGLHALSSNINGYHNTAIGFASLATNDYGADNTAIGHSAMYQNKTGEWNTAVGLQALYSNVSGSNNVAIGRDANFSNTTGDWNTGVGVDAIPGVETGVGNTGVGGESGYTENLANQNVTGNYNTWIGYQSGPSSPEQHDGVIGIGYRSKTSKDYQAVIGSPQIVETLLHGNVGINAEDPTAALVVNGDALNLTGAWGVYSDERLKQDVEPYEDGLSTVMQLRPVRFHYNGLEGLSAEEAQVGLIAQDVERIAPHMISVRNGRDLEDVRTLSTQALPYILINAVQELQERVRELEHADR